jgi:hypothetical protein
MEVAVMSLSAREQEALGFIESDLVTSDPKPASLLATFARLTSGEEMPGREKIQVARRRSTLGARRLCQRIGVRRAMTLLWLFIALALVVVALVVGSVRGTKGTCTNSWPAMCMAPASAHSPRPALREPAGRNWSRMVVGVAARARDRRPRR